jgi:hypothetical protein
MAIGVRVDAVVAKQSHMVFLHELLKAMYDGDVERCAYLMKPFVEQ